MAELIVHEVEPAIVTRLKQRADKHRRSIEDEHKAILRDVLLGTDLAASPLTFEQYLREMPDVGTDADFSRIEGSIRDVSLAD